MKNRNKIVVFFLLIFLLNIVIATSNTTVRFHSLDLESYALEKCTVSGVCERYFNKDIITLEYNSDWIIKVVPLKHFSGVSNKTIYRYWNVNFLVNISAIIGIILLVFWYINFIIGRKNE